jgi:hypothetical protein
MQNRMMNIERKANDYENNMIEGRIKLLAREDTKMLKKIEQTRRLAEKIHQA